MKNNESTSPGTATLQRGIQRARLEPGVPGKNPEPEPETSLSHSETAWHSRGYIPHFDAATVIQHVTFHLADSLPAEALDRIEIELTSIPTERQDVERRKRTEAWIDAGHGSCILRCVDAATWVQNALLHFDAERYRLYAWVVMPNHVHVLFQTINGWLMPKVVASWKSFTGRRLSPLLPDAADKKSQAGAWRSQGRLRRVWHREYWDRFIRDQRHFQTALEYIHNNPVKARLTDKPENWRWSSAFKEKATLERGGPGGGQR